MQVKISNSIKSYSDAASKPASPSTNGPGASKSGPSGPKQKADVNATEVELAATTTSKPRDAKRGKGRGKGPAGPPRPPGQQPQRAAGPSTNKPAPLMQPAATPNGKPKAGECSCCNKNGHWIDKCYAFLKYVLDERIELVKKQGLCFNCLGKGHVSEHCKEDKARCSHCQGNHHSLFCRQKWGKHADDTA